MAGLAVWVTFLIVSIAASRLGLLFPRLGLPLITGYLVVGAIAGPFVLDIISTPDLKPLGYVTQFALAFIAFSAGAELYLPELRSLFKTILYQTSCIAVASFTICTLLIRSLAAGGLIPFMEPLDPGCKWAVASIAASIMVARSPASAIAVVKELKAKGVFTSTLLGITVLCDVYVLLGFTLTTTIAETSCNGDGFSIVSLFIMLGTMLLAMLIGYAIGKLLIFLMTFKRFPARYLILPLGLAVFVAAHNFTDWSEEHLPFVINFEPLLICIVAGYVCTNQSRHRQRFIAVLQQAGPFVFLPFFTVTGASLDLNVLVQSFGFAAIVAIMRAASIFVGSFAGGTLAGQQKQHNMYMWMTLLTQAGVSLGLASEVALKFPGWGRSFQTAIISVVLVNQILGPILFKIAVRRVGEAGKAGTTDEHDEDAVYPVAVLVGGGPEVLMLSSRLLKDKFRVKLLCATEAEARWVTSEIAAWAHADREEAEKGADAVSALVKTVVTKPLGQIREGLKALQEKAAGGAATAAPAAAGAHTAAAHEHGHGPRKLEQFFDACAVVPAGVPASENPLLVAVPPAAPAAAAAAAPAVVVDSGAASAYQGILEVVTTTRHLASVTVLLATDEQNFAVCEAVEAAVRQAPKKSPLHGLRLAARVIDPVWVPAYEALGIVSLTPLAVQSQACSRLIGAPVHRAVALLPRFANNDELSKATGALLDGHHYVQWLQAALAANAGQAHKQASAETISQVQAAVKKHAASHSAAAAASAAPAAPAAAPAPTNMLGMLKQKLTVAVEAEEVPEWQREGYLDAIGSLEDANLHRRGGLAGLFGSGGPNRSQQMEMYGSISSLRQPEEEHQQQHDDGAAGGRGLAGQDQLARNAW